MADFNAFAKPRQEDFDPLRIQQQAEKPLRPEQMVEKARLYSAALGGNPDEYLDIMARGQEMKLKFESERRLAAYEANQLDAETERGIEEGLRLENLVAIREGTFLGSKLLNPTEGLLAANTEASRQELRAYRRAVEFDKLVQEVYADANTGIMDTVGELGDLIIGDGIANVFFNATEDRLTTANMMNQSLYAQIPDEEWKMQSEALLRKMADQGLFTNDSGLYLSSFLEQAKTSGMGQAAYTEQLLSNLDVAMAVGGAVTTGVKSIIRLGKATDAISRTAKAVSEPLAKDMAVAGVYSGDESVNTVKHTTAPGLLPANPDSTNRLGTSIKASEEIEGQNEIIHFIRNQPWAKALDDNQLVELEEAQTLKLKKDLSRANRTRVTDIRIEDDGLGNYSRTITLGTTKRVPFTNIEKAKDLASRVGGEVIEQLHEGKTKYMVSKSDNMPVSNLINPTDVRELTGGFFSSIISTTARTSKQLDAVLKINEGQSSRVFKEVGQRYNRLASKAGKAEIRKVDNILRELNDDPKLANRSDPYTTEEFTRIYEQKNGVAPPQKSVDFYHSQLELNDAEWMLRADPILKRAVENGEKVYHIGGKWTRGKVAKDLDDEAKVLDISTNTWKTKAEMGDNTIHEIIEGGYVVEGKSVRYIHNPHMTERRLYHNDVMGYNPGGSRIYEDAKFFLKQNKRRVFADGTPYMGKPRTFMGVATEKEARQASEDIEALRLAMMDNTISDDLISKHNAWNPNIQTTDDLKEFFDDWGLSFDEAIDFAPDGEPLTGLRFAGPETTGPDYWAMASGARRRPLMAYGGDLADTLDPTAAIERSFAVSINRFANQAYIQRATQGWLKAATDLGMITNLKEIEHLSPIEKLRSAKISKLDYGVKANSRFEAERNLINSKLNYKTRDMIAWNKFVQSAADKIYDGGSKGFAKKVRNIGEPTGFLRSMAFNMKLGLFAVDQVMVQASQIVNIVGVAGMTGLRGSVNVVPLRLALLAKNEDTIRSIARRGSNVTGIDEDTFVGMLQWVRESGRDLVDHNIIELDGNHTLYKSNMKKFLDLGRTPFNEGELYARLSGVSTAYLDYIKKFPDGNPFSDAGRQWITNRQDLLTASMTSASGAPWQRSSLAVPTQFLTYHMRMMEQLFVKGILTNNERGRLAAAQAVFFGGAGILPYGYFSDKLLYESDVEMSPEVYTLVRYGMLDYALQNLTGADTALSARLGVGEGATDLMKKIYDGTVLEFAAGPSGIIAYDTMNAVYELGSNMFSGKWDYASYDWQRLARNITSYSRGYNSWVASRQGEYLNRKTGEPLVRSLDQADAFMLGLGIPLQETETAFIVYENQKTSKERLREHANKMREMKRIMQDYLDDNDAQGARRVSNDIAAMYNLLKEYEKDEVLRILNREEGDFLGTMLEREFEKGRKSTITNVAREMNEDG